MYSSERLFIETALTHIDVLEGIWGGDAIPVASRKIRVRTNKSLEFIVHAAANVQARGVARAAVLCEDVLMCTGNSEPVKLRQALARLQGLIHQYADGLYEIDPAFKIVMQGGFPDEDMLVPAETTPLEVSEDHTFIVSVAEQQNNEPIVLSLKERHDQAKNLLEPLLYLVSDTSQAEALDVLRGRKKTIQAEVKDETSRTDTALARRVKFETLMRSVTSLTLSEARYSGKKISISYAADFDDLEGRAAKHLQAILEVLCLTIVTRGVSPAYENRPMQISLNGSAHTDEIMCDVSWPGQELDTDPQTQTHFNQAVGRLNALGGGLTFKAPKMTDGEDMQRIVVRLPLGQRYKKTATRSQERPVIDMKKFRARGR
jgi:hypothetical protein